MTMRRALLGAAATISLLAIPALAADAVPPAAEAAVAPDTITCGTPIAWDATEEGLKAQFGAENVEYKDLGGPEGTEMFGTQIFGKDSKKTFDIVWSDAEKRANPSMVDVNQVWSEDGETATAPTWKSAEGIYVGMSIEEVEKLNGKPFKLLGFGWDYGGSIVSWEGGKLEPAADAKCGVSLRLGDTAFDSTPPELTGDVEIMSNAKGIEAAKVKVGGYTVYYVRPDPETPAPTP